MKSFMIYANWRNSLALFVLIIFSACTAQEWISASKSDQLELQYRWEELSTPSESGAELRFHVWVRNTGSSAVEYDMGVEFFLNGKLEESSGVERKCAKAGVSYKGKLSGTYFEPEGLKIQDLKDSLITVEFAPLNVTPAGDCIQ